jgi:mRNA-degrading endonuclease RelE of RelBE toxin-antitoxin system
MWRVVVARSADRATARFPPHDRARLAAALDSMAGDPLSGDVRKLSDGAFRRRVGDYRILFSIDFAGRTVNVVAILRRTSTTY